MIERNFESEAAELRANERDFWQQDYDGNPERDPTEEELSRIEEDEILDQEVENFAEDEMYFDWE